MTKYIVELYSLPREMAELKKVEVELDCGATLRDIVAALRRKIPALEGHVIRAGEDRLLEHYMFNINGSFYFDNAEFQVHDGDRIALLTIATGG